MLPSAPMALRVYNTLTRTKEPFVTAVPRVARMYACGLTVYAPMHIGHARTYCFWDNFRRYLEYRGYHFLSVINYTDIDDRIIDKTTETMGWLDVVEGVIARFRTDCRSLKIKDYSSYTRATDFIPHQVEAIDALIERGHAYVVDGEVLYDVRSFERYGQLSGNTLEGGRAGASGRLSDEASRKRHPADFTLWKPSKPGEPTWSTGREGWSSGRPGWHIECSAMSCALLGSHFDVHGGAVDNLFPHHENEIAQSEPVHGHPWVRYWMHPEHLSLRDESGEPIKMSKSLGNVIDIPTLLSRHSPDEVRWFFAATHYRTKLAFSWDLVSAEVEGFKKIRRLVHNLADRLRGSDPAALGPAAPSTYASLRDEAEAVPRDRGRMLAGKFRDHTAAFITRFVEGMDDDMGSPAAIAAMFDYVRELNAAGIDTEDDPGSLMAVYRCLVRHLAVFGIEFADPQLYPEAHADTIGGGEQSRELDSLRGAIDKLLQVRQQARADRDFARADLIRDVLLEAGLAIEDTPAGPRWRVED